MCDEVCENSMTDDNIQLYLSKDIIQGECIPFYLTWGEVEIKQIDLNLDGFDEVIEYHNVIDSFSSEKLTIMNTDLKSQRYFGGVLKAGSSDEPFQKAKFTVNITLDDGIIKLDKERTLFTTKIEIANIPELIELPFEKPQIDIELRGDTTIFIDLESDEDSDIRLELPKEIQNAIERFTSALFNGLTLLKEEFPEHSTLLDLFLDLDEDTSEAQFIDKFTNEMMRVEHDTDFAEAFALTFVGAFLGQSGIRDVYLRPLLEYFESNATTKAFFHQPFLVANVPKGVGFLKGRIQYEDLLENLGSPIDFEVKIQSDEPVLIPIKQLFTIRRDR